jgi:hypothetical protein
MIITRIIEVDEKWDIMTTNIPNAFVQTSSGFTKEGERIIIKVRDTFVNMLDERNSQVCKEHVSFENGSKILYALIYVERTIAIYDLF